MAKDFDVFIPEIVPLCPGCPDYLIERVTREAIIELCKDAKVLRCELEPISLIAGEHEYELDLPAHTALDSIHYLSYNGVMLEPVTERMLENRTAEWRTETGTPTYYIKKSNNKVWIVPQPAASEVNAVTVGAILKPNRTATTFDDELYEDYFDEIVNNVLARLMRMPKKDWSDKGSAGEYYALYARGAANARKRARRADGNNLAPVVRYGGISAGRHKGDDYGRPK